MTIWDTVPGHPDVVAQLQAAARQPVHAYLLVGPPGAGARAAATAFAGALVCERGGCGVCRDCTLVLAGEHPDVEMIEPDKTRVSVDQARDLAQRSSLAPSEGRRRVMVLTDFHRVEEAAPALLKTIEEPPATTVFVILADQVHDDLVTIASRCVRIEVPRLSSDAIAEQLVAQGVDAERALTVARASLGDLDRARVLLADPQLEARRATWWTAPDRLDGTGAAVAAVAAEIRERIELAAGPLKEVHSSELGELEAWVAEHGERGSGRAKLVTRHNAEARRQRAEELRFG
ncbi:MAG: polymerase subunit delta, partial [Actinomycetota bacterium]|nr:polymerase subunit delta [Actinomycetota bacterium]